MRHVYHEQGTYLVGNLAHTLIIPFTTVCRATADYKFRFVLNGESFHLIIVHTTCFRIKVIANSIVKYTTGIYGRAMRQVSSMSKIKSHESITGLKYRKQYSRICLSSGMWLYVRELGTEEFLDTLYGKCLNLIHNLATTIISLSRISLGILVCKA